MMHIYVYDGDDDSKRKIFYEKNVNLTSKKYIATETTKNYANTILVGILIIRY